MRVKLEFPEDKVDRNHIVKAYINDVYIPNIKQIDNMDNIPISNWFRDNENQLSVWTECEGVKLMDNNGKITLSIFPNGWSEYFGHNL